jgi:hypothetical protein
LNKRYNFKISRFRTFLIDVYLKWALYSKTKPRYSKAKHSHSIPKLNTSIDKVRDPATHAGQSQATQWLIWLCATSLIFYIRKDVVVETKVAPVGTIAVVVAKNTARGCSEPVSGPILSNQREDMKFE